jgi:hypothetical protein
MGALLVALYFLERHARPVPVTRPEAVVALVVGSVMASAGAVGFVRSRRMGARLTAGSLAVRGLLQNRVVPLTDIVDAGLVRSGTGDTLYCRVAGGGGFLVHAVSASSLSTSTAAPASDVAREVAVRARLARGQVLPPLADPLPDLAEAPWIHAPFLPPAMTVVARGPDAAAGRRLVGHAVTLSVANAAMVGVFAAALACTSPSNYTTGIIVAAAAWVVLQAVARIVPVDLRLRRRSIALGPGAVAARAPSGWKVLDLADLAGVGLDDEVVLDGILRRPATEPALVLVASDGRRLSFPRSMASPAMVAQLRDAAARSGATVTGAAAPTLAGGAPPTP